MAVEILAHRANLTGPNPPAENSVEACHRALEAGFGLEIDLRRDHTDQFYISHNPASRTPENALEAYRGLFQSHAHLPIAVNVKELGCEEALIHLQKSAVFGGVHDFYFDFELLEQGTPLRALHLLTSLPGGQKTRFATRLSDRHEPLSQCLSISGYAAWADEFDSLWLTMGEIHSLHRSGRRVYVISPELHGFTPSQRRSRWAQFKEWGVDGLCTDYPLEARDFFA